MPPRRQPGRVPGGRGVPPRVPSRGGPARVPARRPMPARAVGRPRRVRRRPSRADHRIRVRVVRILLVVGLVATGVKLVQVQAFEAPALSAKSSRQRAETVDVQAIRGSIVDRNGSPLAFSVEVRTLSYRPQAMRKQWDEAAAKHPGQFDTFAVHSAKLAKLMHDALGVDEQAMLTKIRSSAKFVYLVNNVDPSRARLVTDQFPEVSAEVRAVRDYPGQNLASNIVGVANWRMDDPDTRNHNLHGLSGLESSLDLVLSGAPGHQVVDTEEGDDGVVIPGTVRQTQAAVDGSDVVLTIDGDVQYYLQEHLAAFAKKAGAHSASAVIMDAHTGEVYALANDKSFDPNKPTYDRDAMGNPAVAIPYEPGSVNKVVTALSAIEYGTTTPTAMHEVPGSINFADRTIHDAWPHGTLQMTTTGIFAKSSNVGTLELAQRIGPQRFADMLKRLGLGQRTGIGLPGESPGSVPPLSQWSGSTFGNLPIGQGLSMTVLQMASMYQTVANDGVRVPPRIISAEVRPDGTRVQLPRPQGIRVVKPQTAVTVRNMLRAVTQGAPYPNTGTAPQAALPGYQISGKTGTAQQINPVTHSYSNSNYWITFAGILPADSPRFVVGIVLDRPVYTSPDGHSAAPLFHDVASFLAQKYNIPLSKTETPLMQLQLP
jgi:cell division protein FtsI (penicillin-binding protein 3)